MCQTGVFRMNALPCSGDVSRLGTSPDCWPIFLASEAVILVEKLRSKINSDDCPQSATNLHGVGVQNFFGRVQTDNQVRILVE